MLVYGLPNKYRINVRKIGGRAQAHDVRLFQRFCPSFYRRNKILLFLSNGMALCTRGLKAVTESGHASVCLQCRNQFLSVF